MLNLNGIEYTDGLPVDRNFEKSLQYFKDRRIIIVSNVDFSSNNIKLAILDTGTYGFNLGKHNAIIKYLENGYIIALKE